MTPHELVAERSQGRCERCGVWSESLNHHHRQPRGMGGTSKPDRASNLVALCGSGTTGCHGDVESRRAIAKVIGLLVSQYDDPAEVPVWMFGVGMVLLRDDGSYERVDQEPAA